MLSVNEALTTLLNAAKPISDTETVAVIDALQRVLAQPIISSIDVPPADNSAMDGYALAAHSVMLDDVNYPTVNDSTVNNTTVNYTIVNDSKVDHSTLDYKVLNHSSTLSISQRIPAGHSSKPLEPGTAARIFTGGEIPPGADTIVMQENCESDGKNVRILQPVKTGQHIRKRGEDIAAGTTLLPQGNRLQPTDLGVIASIGIAEVSVYRRLRIGIVSSGDELCNPGEPLTAGKIYNSNRFTLTGLIESQGFSVRDFGHIPDDLSITKKVLKDAATQVDVMISTGGVSVGEEDHIKAAVEELGNLALWKLAVKPGKPLAFGHIGTTPFFGLPGNPVSTFVTFQIVALPFLLKTQGLSKVTVDSLSLAANFTFEKNETRQEYLRVRIEDSRVIRFDNQSSGALSSASWANALAVIPPNTDVAPGDFIQVIPYAYFHM